MHRLAPALLAITALAAIQLAAPAASAQIYSPWCANYSGDMDGSSNCGFSTLEQCRATISGIGGTCEPNQFYLHANKPDRATRKRARN